ncbi:hypothetical protein [Streptomyces sp. NPDC059708]|uniref:hypothetical protein n=1 Tax=Streptomyces sp. NPDC059708 TaxID=3346916 RepID=UPI0036B63D0C
MSRARVWKKRALADPDGPQLPVTAYHFFFLAKRTELLKGSPSMDFVSVGTTVHREWAVLNAAGRAPYVEQARVERDRYRQEIAQWRRTLPSR